MNGAVSIGWLHADGTQDMSATSPGERHDDAAIADLAVSGFLAATDGAEAVWVDSDNQEVNERVSELLAIPVGEPVGWGQVDPAPIDPPVLQLDPAEPGIGRAERRRRERALRKQAAHVHRFRPMSAAAKIQRFGTDMKGRMMLCSCGAMRTDGD